MNVAVATGFFAGAGGAMQVRNKFFEISNQQRQSFRFRAQRKQPLFEIQIERQRRSQIERHQRRISRGQILFRVRHGQEFGMQLNGTGRILLRRRASFIFDHEDFRLQEGTILIHFEEFEALPAFGHQVQPSVRIFFNDGDNFGGASHIRKRFLTGPHYAEQSILSQALRHHLFVARLKNMQRQGRAGE